MVFANIYTEPIHGLLFVVLSLLQSTARKRMRFWWFKCHSPSNLHVWCQNENPDLCSETGKLKLLSFAGNSFFQLYLQYVQECMLYNSFNYRYFFLQWVQPLLQLSTRNIINNGLMSTSFLRHSVKEYQLSQILWKSCLNFEISIKHTFCIKC